MSNKKEELLSILDSFNIQVPAGVHLFRITIEEQPDELLLVQTDWVGLGGVSS